MINASLRLMWRALGFTPAEVRRWALMPYFYPNKFKPSSKNTWLYLAPNGTCVGDNFTAGMTLEIQLCGVTDLTPVAVVAQAVVVKSGSTTGAEIAIPDGATPTQIIDELANWFALNQYLAQFAQVTQVIPGTVIRWQNEFNDEFGFNIAGVTSNVGPAGTMIGTNKLEFAFEQFALNYRPGFVIVGPSVKRLFVPVTYYPRQPATP